jgi:hypothetical protein
MQTWEYARLVINWVDVNYSMCKLTLFLPGGRKAFSSEPSEDAWAFFDKQLCDLGREGWELVNVAPMAGGLGEARTTAWHLWFKRPCQS